MSRTIAEAAEVLGITANGVRHRLKTGQLRGRKTQNGWRVYDLNGVDSSPDNVTPDPLEEIADEMISLGKRLKKAMKAHDEEIRRQVIRELGESLVNEVEKG